MLESIGWEFQYTPYTPVLLVAATIMASIGGYAWQRRDVTGATTFVVLMSGATFWAVSYALQLAGANEATIAFWADLNHVGVAIVPVAWFCFILQFTARDHWLTPRTLTALSAVPTAYLVLVATNRYHYWVRDPVETVTVLDGTLIVSQHSFGPAFWMHSLYGYGLTIAGVVMLGHLLVWSPTVYRGQVGLLVFGTLAAATTNVIYHAGFSPFPYLDLTPFSFTISGLVFFVAIYHYRLFDLTPVARSMVVDTLDDGIIVLDRNDRVVDINETAQTLLDQPSDEAIGRPFESLLPETATTSETPLQPSDMEDTTVSSWPPTSHRSRDTTSRNSPGRNRTSPAVNDPPEAAVEELAIDDESTRRYLRLRSTPIVDLGGRPLGRSIVVSDVTETRELQAAVEESLRQLRRSNEELDSFATVVSHDLREPLRTTEQYLSLFEAQHDEKLSVDEAELLSIARENAERSQTMITDLLEYSRIGHEADEFEPVDCNEVVTAVVDGLRFEIDERSATVTVGDLPTVSGIEHLIYRLFQNLLSNALTYTDTSEPHIEVSATDHDDGWRFEVCDDGIGIPAGELEYVFDLFTRGTGVHEHDGTGVGLAVCEKIIEVHGGTIGIDSTVDVGTTVSFTIPENTPSIDAGPS